MSRVEAAAVVELAAAEARAVWSDLDRWPSFVEGFAHVAEVRGDWPAAGARVVWESTPGGRGRVTEEVLDDSSERFATRVIEDALEGEQSARFTPVDEGRARVDLRLEYELSDPGLVKALSDLLFIRRALRDALKRTLRRYAREAAGEAEP